MTSWTVFQRAKHIIFSIGLTFIYIKKRGSSFILNIASNPVKNIIMLETSVKLTKLFYVLLLSDNGCFFFFFYQWHVPAHVIHMTSEDGSFSPI